MRHIQRIPLLALFLGTMFIIATGCGTTIRAGQKGIKYIALDDPALESEVRAEGFYFQWPWNSLIVYDVTWQSETESVEILTEDDLHISTNITITYRPDDTRLHDLQTQIGPDYYVKVIRPAFETIARSEFAKHKHNDLAEHSPAIEQEILAKLREEVTGRPFEIGRVLVTHIEFNRTVAESISKKLAMQQAAEQKSFEMVIAERDADIARTRAKGEADAIQIRAMGEAKAIEIKGEAQSTAQAAIARSLTPSYLRFKAFDNPATKYYFVPIGKDGMPIIIGTDHPSRAQLGLVDP